MAYTTIKCPKPKINVKPEICTSVDFLISILGSSSQPFVVCDGNGMIVWCNDAYCRLTGYTREELSSMSCCRNLTPPEWQALDDGIAIEQVRSKIPASYRKEYVIKDGSKIPIELYKHVIFDATGRPHRYIAFVNGLADKER